MTQARIPAAILAALPPGAEPARLLAAARSGATRETLEAEWPLALERRNARRRLVAGYLLVAASAPLVSVVTRHLGIYSGDALAPLATGLILSLLTPVLIVFFLPLIALFFLVGLVPEGETTTSFLENLPYVALALLSIAANLAGFALIAKARKRSPWLAFLGVCGLLFRSRRGNE